MRNTGAGAGGPSTPPTETQPAAMRAGAASMNVRRSMAPPSLRSFARQPNSRQQYGTAIHSGRTRSRRHEFQLHIVEPQRAAALHHRAYFNAVGAAGDGYRNRIALPASRTFDGCVEH